MKKLRKLRSKLLLSKKKSLSFENFWGFSTLFFLNRVQLRDLLLYSKLISHQNKNFCFYLNFQMRLLSKRGKSWESVKGQVLGYIERLYGIGHGSGTSFKRCPLAVLKENCFCMHFRKNGISPRWLKRVLFFLLLFLGFVCMKKMAPRNWGECQGFYLKWGSENGPWKWVYGPLVANVGIFSAILRAKWRPCGWSSKPSKPFLVLPHNTRMTASQSFTT